MEVNNYTVGECVDIILYQNKWHGKCMEVIVSKAVGYSIVILTACLLKTPQIMKILQARSSRGLSFTGELLQLVTNSSACTYSIAKAYPISTWGESIFMAVQSLIICVLILIYNRRHKAAVITVGVYVFLMAVLLSSMTPDWLLAALQLLTLPFITIGKSLQIWANYRNKGTGVLSAISVFAYNLRSLGRLFTHLSETGDPIKISIYGMGSFLNLILSGQMIYYNMMKAKDEKLKKS